jgi:multidrug efflux pump
MFTRFFIDRPIFATVISVVITLAGFVSVFALPVAQYPEVTPPTVLVTAFYPGANAKTVRDTVAAPIEAQVSGVEGMVYMMSQCTNDGAYKLTVTFKASSDSRMDSDMAQVLVQNRVSLALPVIPAIVQNEGISVKKMSPNTLMIVNLVSPDGSKDNIFLSNYATINVKDELGRLPGIAGITYLGQRDYSLRAWLDPDKLAARGLSGMDVVTAIAQQNVQVAAGQIGQPPTTRAQQFQLTINTQGRLTDPEQFANVIIKAGRTVAGQAATATAAPTPTLGANATTATAPQATAIVRLRDVVRANRYFMRVQLDPDKLKERHLEIAEVVDSLKPNPIKPTPLSIVADGQPVDGQTRIWLLTYGGSQPPHIDEVAKTVVHTGAKPADTVRLRDVVASDGITHLQSRDEEGVQLGSQQYDQSCTLDGKPSVALSIYQLPGSNALDTAKGVYAKMRELKKRFPAGVDYKIVYDTTPFIQESVDEVWHTLRDAVILVAIVVLLFLQDWRAMILPMIDVPVSLVGTFAVMAAMGFTLNNLTLFGLVLAIGIVVDDAIVVLENIERLMATGLDARTATIRAMDEITGPILAITLVLSAVFIPCCFLGGLTGQFFRQFAVTIAVSTIISAINAITMTPSRAVLIFKTEQAEHGGHELKREALPWWAFAIFGGIATYMFLPKLLVIYFDMPEVTDIAMRGGPLTIELVPWHKSEDGVTVPSWMSLAAATVYFLPGMLVGGIFGWLCIRPTNAVLGWTFRGFNRAFDRMTAIYGKTIAHILRVAVLVCILYGGLLLLTGWQFMQAPTGFIPQQDKGYLILNVQLPDAASVDRTERIMAHIERLVRGNKREAIGEDEHPEEMKGTRIARRYPGLPGVAHTVGVSGQSLILNANAPNLGSMYVLLKDFDKRHSADLSADAIANDIVTLCRDGGYILTQESLEAMQTAGAADASLQKLKPMVGKLFHLQKLKDRLSQRLSESEQEQIEPLVLSQAERVPPVFGASVTAFGGPPVDGLGTTGGFKLIIEDRGNIGQAELQTVCENIVKKGNKTEGLTGLSHSSRASTPWLYLEIDRDKAQVLGVSVKDVFDTLQVYFGSYYINNFNEFGRTWQVNVQADQKYRAKVTDIRQLQVRNNQGMMVRVGTFMDVREDTTGPVMVMRYNMYAATAITGNTAPGTSSGQAIDMMQEIADRELPHSMAYEWTELTYLQLEAGNKAMFVFALAVMFVFLVLAAQYESWSLPLAVILVVPMCLLCSVTGIMFAKMEVNIFTQIGFVVLVGLASKNAILIVEFAKQRREEGVGAWEATLEASQLRLRPILMTSFAFILGVVPLVIAQGAGAEMRRSLGLAVFAGMCGVTLFGIFLTPVFYYVIQRWTPVTPKPHDGTHTEPVEDVRRPATEETQIKHA